MKYVIAILALLLLVGCGGSETAPVAEVVDEGVPAEPGTPEAAVEDTEFVSEDDLDLGDLI